MLNNKKRISFQYLNQRMLIVWYFVTLLSIYAHVTSIDDDSKHKLQRYLVNWKHTQLLFIHQILQPILGFNGLYLLRTRDCVFVTMSRYQIYVYNFNTFLDTHKIFQNLSSSIEVKRVLIHFQIFIFYALSTMVFKDILFQNIYKCFTMFHFIRKTSF